MLESLEESFEPIRIAANDKHSEEITENTPTATRLECQCERLAQSEKMFRTLAENYPDIIIRFDRSCRRIYVNPTFVRLSGRSPEALLGQLPTDDPVLVAPRYFTEKLKEVFETGHPCEIEAAAWLQNGEIGWTLISLVPEYEGTEIITILAVARDVTQAKKYEESLQKSAWLKETLSQIASHLPGFFCILRRSAQGAFALPYTSSGITSLTGLIPGELIEDVRPLVSLIPPKDSSRLEKQVLRSASDMLPLSATFRIRRPGRDDRWIEIRANPQRDQDNADEILWYGIALDITERHQDPEHD